MVATQHLVERKCLVQQQPRQCLCYPSVPSRRPQASNRPQVSAQVVASQVLQEHPVQCVDVPVTCCKLP